MNDEKARYHAFVVWLYIKECSELCYLEARQDYEFMRLNYDMYRAYPDEFEYVIGGE